MTTQSRDIEDRFFVKLKDIAEKLGADPLEMMSVMMSESGVSATAHNPHGDASGLIQFMPDTLRRLGWKAGHAEFRKLSAYDQLDFVERYYMPYKGHLSTVAGLYVATFLPALVSHCDDSDYVLCAHAGQLGWAYDANAVFDANHDGAITVGELEDAVVRNAHGPRWEELKARLIGRGLDAPDPAPDTGTISGMQMGLALLGYLESGQVDGVYGPVTRDAVKQFQADNELVADGVYGPLTRGALDVAIG